MQIGTLFVGFMYVNLQGSSPEGVLACFDLRYVSLAGKSYSLGDISIGLFVSGVRVTSSGVHGIEAAPLSFRGNSIFPCLSTASGASCSQAAL